MLVRLLIYIILGTVLYRAAKSWFGRPESSVSRGKMKPSGQVDDAMIKDPVCGTYFPQSMAVVLNEKGPTLYFCSTECRDRYVADERMNQPGGRNS
jgi:uncharacterized protein